MKIITVAALVVMNVMTYSLALPDLYPHYFCCVFHQNIILRDVDTAPTRTLLPNILSKWWWKCCTWGGIDYLGQNQHE